MQKQRAVLVEIADLWAEKKNPEKRERQLRVSKRKYPYKQMRKEEREGAIPVEIGDLREKGKKNFLEKRKQQLRVKERQYPYKQISSSGKIKFQRGGRWKIQEGDEILEKMQVVRDFGNFVNRARRSFGENTGSGGFLFRARRKKFLEKMRVEGDFGHFA